MRQMLSAVSTAVSSCSPGRLKTSVKVLHSLCCSLFFLSQSSSRGQITSQQQNGGLMVSPVRRAAMLGRRVSLKSDCTRRSCAKARQETAGR